MATGLLGAMCLRPMVFHILHQTTRRPPAEAHAPTSVAWLPNCGSHTSASFLMITLIFSSGSWGSRTCRRPGRLTCSDFPWPAWGSVGQPAGLTWPYSPSNMANMKVKTAELKDHLSHYLRRVRAGETITVCDREEPVAAIIPLPFPETSPFQKDQDALGAKLRAVGLDLVAASEPHQKRRRHFPMGAGKTGPTVVQDRAQKDY